MTQLSFNINKIALLRNSRGRNYPNVLSFAQTALDQGAHGITLHPRPDQRHARYSDVHELGALCAERSVELNVEGYPTEEFLQCVLAHAKHVAQCTLVPDAPGQITSDHGWDLATHAEFLRPILARLRAAGIRTSLFVDHTNNKLDIAKAIGADRVELYTEPYAELYETEGDSANLRACLKEFERAALQAHSVGLGVNAGHDLNLQNLALFLTIPNILEVSIGHAIIVESLTMGLESVIQQYVEICKVAAA